MIHAEKGRRFELEGTLGDILTELSVIFSALMKPYRDTPEKMETVKGLIKKTADFSHSLMVELDLPEDKKAAREEMEEILEGGEDMHAYLKSILGGGTDD